MLLLRLPGSLLFRFADRQFLALLFQLPPRFTRLEPTLLRRMSKNFLTSKKLKLHFLISHFALQRCRVGRSAGGSARLASGCAVTSFLAPHFSSGIGTIGEAHAEADGAVAVAGRVAVPARRTAIPGAVAPAATARHVVRARCT